MNESEPINWLNPKPLNFEEKEPSPPHKRRWVFVLVFICLFFAGCAIRNFTLSAWPTAGDKYDPVTLKPKKVGLLTTVKNMVLRSNNVLEGQTDDRINILLLGMGGAGHDGPYLTDTNIILSIKPSTKEIAMVSVPRDLGVEINGFGLRKINYANAYGEANTPGQGGEYARQVFAKQFDLDIPYYIRVDFKAFEELIDEVGGITVDVKTSFTDSLFPGENYSYKTVSFTAGKQTMNGITALQYARSRHGNNGEGSDFARSRRQQQILTALKDKLLSFGTYTNPVRVQNILNTLSSHISTNLDFGQMMYLAGMARDIQSDIKMLVLDNGVNGYLRSFISPSGAFVLAPVTNNFQEINDAILNVFTVANKSAEQMTGVNPAIFTTAKIEVQNGTWLPGLAAKMAARLQSIGFSALTPRNSAKRPFETTQIYVVKKGVDQEITKALQKELGGAIINGLPNWVPINPASSTTVGDLGYSPEADIIVVLGTDTKE